MSDWFLGHLPADHVPYWDFSAPGIPDAPRDTSAAAIAAHGAIYGDYYLQEALLRLRRQPPAGASLPVAAVSASGDDGNVPANAVDGDRATRWSASGDGQWLQLDFGQARTLTKVSVAFHRGASRAARASTSSSLDGATWTTLVRTSSSATTLAPENYDVPDTSARHLRLVGHGATGSSWNSVSEIAVR